MVPESQSSNTEQAAMEEQIASLVEVNSFTDNVEGGRKVAAMLRDVFALDGMSSKTTPSTRYADHLVFSSNGSAGKAPLALVGHVLLHGGVELPPGRGGILLLQDSRPSPDHLGQGPIRHAFAVGQAPTLVPADVLLDSRAVFEEFPEQA